MGNNITRRSTLQSIAAGTALIGGLGTGVGAAGESSKVDPCEDCGSLLTKYEWEDGGFVWEKGRDSLNIDGDDFEITVTETNEEGEPLAFEWASVDPLDSGGLYDATCLTVKTGEGVFKVDCGWRTSGSFDARNYDDDDPVQAISNLALCIRCAFWQVDFGVGPVPELYTDGEYPRDEYNDGERWLLAAQTHGRGTGECSDLSKWTVNEDNSDAVVVGDRIQINDDLSEATIAFEVLEREHVHFGAWEMPGPFDKSEMEFGPRYDLIEVEDLEPGDYEWTIALPTA